MSAVLHLILCIIVVIIAYIVSKIYSVIKIAWKIKDIPDVPYNYPIIGVSVFLATLDISEFPNYTKILYKKCPHIGKGLLISKYRIILMKPDYIETLLKSTNHIKKGSEYELMRPWLGDGLLLSEGSKWHRGRKLLTPAFHFKILDKCTTNLYNHSRKLVRNLLASNGEPFPLETFVKSFTIDVICDTAMGVELNAQDDQSKDYIKAVDCVSEIILKRLTQALLRSDWMFSLTSYKQEFDKSLVALHSFTEKIIASRRELFKSNQDNGSSNKESSVYSGKKPFLDCLLALDMENPGLLTLEDIRDEVETFMLGGSDTTTSAIVFAIYLLGLHPKEQDRVAEEQFKIFGSDNREATLQDLQSMCYLELVIKEVLRLYPSVPFISRELTEDLILSDGLKLPAGVDVIVLPFALHRDEKYWKSPEDFIPERFSETRHPFSYVPFSAGSRNCIGQKFAMLELKSVLSTVIRFCKIEAVTKPEDVKIAPLVTIRLLTPVEVRVTPRI